MTDQERYLFDLHGYLLLEGVLGAEQIAALEAIFDEQLNKAGKADAPNARLGGLLGWGKPYRDLLDLDRIYPYVQALCGDHPRLDHVYADQIRSGLSPIGATLHGGAVPFDPTEYYTFRDGRMYNGLIVVAYNLREVRPGQGGFACVPGSHKANYRLPSGWVDLREPAPCVAKVSGPAGSVVIFTEALTHGPLPWTGEHARRTLFYKYSPHCVSWAAQYFDPNAYADLTPRQRAILESPNARYGGRPTDPNRQGK